MKVRRNGCSQNLCHPFGIRRHMYLAVRENILEQIRTGLPGQLAVHDVWFRCRDATHEHNGEPLTGERYQLAGKFDGETLLLRKYQHAELFFSGRNQFAVHHFRSQYRVGIDVVEVISSIHELGVNLRLGRRGIDRIVGQHAAIERYWHRRGSCLRYVLQTCDVLVQLRQIWPEWIRLIHVG